LETARSVDREKPQIAGIVVELSVSGGDDVLIDYGHDDPGQIAAAAIFDIRG